MVIPRSADSGLGEKGLSVHLTPHPRGFVPLTYVSKDIKVHKIRSSLMREMWGLLSARGETATSAEGGTATSSGLIFNPNIFGKPPGLVSSTSTSAGGGTATASAGGETATSAGGDTISANVDSRPKFSLKESLQGTTSASAAPPTPFTFKGSSGTFRKSSGLVPSTSTSAGGGTAETATSAGGNTVSANVDSRPKFSLKESLQGTTSASAAPPTPFTFKGSSGTFRKSPGLVPSTSTSAGGGTATFNIFGKPPGLVPSTSTSAGATVSAGGETATSDEGGTATSSGLIWSCRQSWRYTRA